MWRLGWIDPADYSFDCMLRMERFQIRMMLESLDEGERPVMAAALKAAESERDAAAAVYAEEDPESAGNVAIRKQVTEEMIAEASAEIDALREQSEETDAAIRVAEEKIAELQGVEGYDYYRAIYDEYVEGRAYVEDLLSGD